MPSGSQPITPASTQIFNDTSLKVFYRTSLSGAWKLDTSLIFTGSTKTNGIKTGQASFFVLESGNQASDYPAYNDDVAARVFNAAQKYNVDLEQGYLNPYYVKVTKVNQGETDTIFLGYINTVDWDGLARRTRAVAGSYANLLDGVDLYGSFVIDTADAFSFHFDDISIFNPKGVGNKSTLSVTNGGFQAFGIDKTLDAQNESDSNKHSVLNIINNVLARGYSASGSPWDFVAGLYDGAVKLAVDTDATGDKLVASFAPNGYRFQDKTMWATLTELVESVEGLALTEEIDPTGRAYLLIVNLKA